LRIELSYLLPCFLSEATTWAVFTRSSRQMQSVEHSPEAQTLGIEAMEVPGLIKVIKPSTEHSQSGKHRPSAQGEIVAPFEDDALNPFAEEVFAPSLEGSDPAFKDGTIGSPEEWLLQSSVGFMSPVQAQSQWHWSSSHGSLCTAKNAGACELTAEAMKKSMGGMPLAHSQSFQH